MDADSPQSGFGRFLADLGRRRVGRVAVTYLAVAWFFIEVAGTTFPMLGLPDAAGRWLIGLLLAGFPVALGLGWAFDIGPEGIERTAPTGSADSVPERPSRAWALVAAGAALGAGLVWAVPRFAAGPAAPVGDDAPSANVIAVLPFEVRGSEQLAYLGEGIVDLMSAKLNGAGAFTTVDPRLVVSAVTEAGGSVSGEVAGRALARGVGAGRYVTGELVEAAGLIQLTAHLHETEQSDDPSQQATVEGAAADIFGLLDHLAAELLASSLTAEGDRLQALATLTTPSLEAAKAYLQGEQFLRRGLYREAAVEYDRAVQADTAFALAHYRKSIAADWIDAYTARSDADRAYAFREKLPPRDQALVAALRLRRRGMITEAEQALRALLHQYPNDIEGLIQLGELYFHDNSRRGRAMSESMDPFRRSLELEPLNPIAQVHLARVYALEDSLGLLRESAELLDRVAPESERALEVLALHGYMAGDTAIQRRVKDETRNRPWYYTFHAAHGVGRFARDPFGAADVLASRPTEDALLQSLVPNTLVVRGQYRAARDFMDRKRSDRNATWDLYQAFLLTSGAIPLDRDRATALLEPLATMKPTDLRRTAWLEPYEDITDRFFEFQRDYYRALILIQLGRPEDAKGLVSALASQDDFEGMGSVKQDADLSLRAEILLQSGDREGALDALRSMRFEIPHAVSYQPMPDQSRARFLRGELELEFGDAATADAFLVGLDEPWSMWDTYHRPLLYHRLGMSAEDQGRTAEAILYYTRLLELWRECDPELVPTRDDVAARLKALTS